MTDQTLKSRGNVRFRWHADNAFANPLWPQVAELNAGQELEQVTLWDNFEVGIQASETTDSAPIAAKTTVARRGAANYGGTASFWYPGYRADMSNAAALVYAAFKDLNVKGYVSLAVDGEIGEAGQPASNLTYAHGDYLTLLRVTTDEWDDMITGEEAFYYTRTFLKGGSAASYTVASTAAPVLVVTGTGPGATVGNFGSVSATVNGRDYTRGVNWTSSAPQFVSVSPDGVLKRIAAGAATITGTLPGTTAPTTGTYVTV